MVDEGDWNRVTKYELQVLQDGNMMTVISGKIIRPHQERVFNSVKTKKVRLNILEANEVPTIHEIQVFKK